MKTTVDIPEDLQQVVKDIAHDLSLTEEEAVIWLMRRGVGTELPEPEIGVDKETGFPTFRIGRLITASEVKRFLEDEE
jgi:hypothetical protein